MTFPSVFFGFSEFKPLNDKLNNHIYKLSAKVSIDTKNNLDIYYDVKVLSKIKEIKESILDMDIENLNEKNIKEIFNKDVSIFINRKIEIDNIEQKDIILNSCKDVKQILIKIEDALIQKLRRNDKSLNTLTQRDNQQIQKANGLIDDMKGILINDIDKYFVTNHPL